jgi:predicted RNase H-like nuclease
LVASAKVHGTTFAPEEPQILETFAEVLDYRPSFATIALGAPVGYLEEFQVGGRTCDRQTRAILGRRGASIQSPPIRAQLDEGTTPQMDGLSAVSRTLLPRYREVASEMGPYRQRVVYEVSSELSFFQLNEDVPLLWSKRSEKGRMERRELLSRKIPGIESVINAVLPRVPASHLLDVAGFIWTARRVFARIAIRVPEDPEWDEEGLRMEIVR